MTSTAAARLPPEVVAGPAALISLCAVAVIVLGVVDAARKRPRAGATFAAHSGFALELFLAAGLIRLAALDTYRALAIVATIIAIRQVISRGVRLGASTPSRTPVSGSAETTAATRPSQALRSPRRRATGRG